MKIEKIFQRLAEIINEEFSGVVADKDEIFAFLDDEDGNFKIKILNKGIEIDKKLNVKKKDFTPTEELTIQEKEQLMEDYISCVNDLILYFEASGIDAVEEGEIGSEFYSRFLEYYLQLEDVISSMRNAGIIADVSLFDKNTVDNILRVQKLKYEN
jgi:hypothetical protein